MESNRIESNEIESNEMAVAEASMACDGDLTGALTLLAADVRLTSVSGGTLPRYAHRGDACFDCFARERVSLAPGACRRVPLGFRVALPPGHALFVLGRSGLASLGIEVVTGVVDEGYAGEVQAIVRNSSLAKFEVGVGDRIAQACVLQVPTILGVKVTDAERGADGFGSTGV